ncbi:sterol desaturase family protein [Erythrobacter rubeus]|uniref:Sterol desaturase family protein n=1 Tax=Erythrobacter rubeus TaxID=2760803 RepID=A0ABR8KWC7_9SPHN|nr:sterol desaturase family protein [Erythrobacter rubeus]MBD2842734.1 sterol desaturase family protein [Erythrobacter rubeus]
MIEQTMAPESATTPDAGPRSVWRFLLTFAVLLIAAEGLLRVVAYMQEEIGWAVFDAGFSIGMASWSAATANAVMTLFALVLLFGFFEWRQFGFTNFRERYSEGLLYGATAIVIATTLQVIVFAWVSTLEFEPLLRADSLGSLSIVFPLLYMLALGFFEYWLHRALHDIPILWRLHAIHHQIEHLNAARSYSHWAQDALYLSVITVPLVFLIENPQQHLVLLTTFYIVSNYYMHSDNPAVSFPPALRHVLADNVYHHYHHSRAIEHWGRNYCSFFSFYDRIFGTQHMPEDETFHPTGIEGHRPLSGWKDYLFRPFNSST